MSDGELYVNITLDPKKAAADCALAAQLGAHGVRTSQEQGWGDIAVLLAPFRKACDDHGLLLQNCCQPRGHRQPRTAADLADWGDNVAEAASICDQTSGGNELNGFGSAETPDPKAAAVAFLAAIEARDRHAPGRQLLTPSMCPAGGPLGSSYVEPLLFLRTMLEAERSIISARQLWLDWHGYCDGRWDPATPKTWNQCWRTRAVQQLAAQLGYAQKKITWSEWGTATGPPGWEQAIDPVSQAVRFDQQIAEMRAQRKAGVHHGPATWYRLRDSKPSSPDDWPSQTGLVTIDGTPKPVAARFTAAAAKAA